MPQNPNCDNNRCTSSTGPVKLYRFAYGGSNGILCKACFEYENAYRKKRNQQVGEERWEIQSWDKAEPYPN